MAKGGGGSSCEREREGLKMWGEVKRKYLDAMYVCLYHLEG